MKKRQRSSKGNESEFRPFRFQSLTERLNNININVVHRIRYHERTDINDIDNTTHSSHFHDAVEHWSTLNCSESFSRLEKQLKPLSGSLEQVVFNRKQIVDELHHLLTQQDPLVTESLLDLIVQLARDLQGDFYLYYKEFLFADIVGLLLGSKDHKTRKQNAEINTNLLEQVFQCLTYLFKYLWRIMLKDLAQLYELYSKLLFSPKDINTTTKNYEYIRSFAAESFAYLLRKIENYQPFVDYLFDRRERDEDEIESLALVFSEACRNVQSSFHSCTKSLIQSLMRKFIEKPTQLESTLRTIYSLLVEHTNKENVSILWTCLDEVHRTIEQRTVDPTVHRTFYELIQSLIDRRMIFDAELWNILTRLEKTSDELLLRVHYQTMAKLIEHVPIDKKFMDVYFRFSDQSSAQILDEETKIVFENDHNNKLTDEFHRQFWTKLVAGTEKQEDLVGKLVDYVLIHRRKLDMIFLPRDDDQTLRNKFDLIRNKKTILTEHKITAEIIEIGRSFVENVFGQTIKINSTNGVKFLQALILLNSLPSSELKSSKLEENSSKKILDALNDEESRIAERILILFELLIAGCSFPTDFWFDELKENSESKMFLLVVRSSFLVEKFDGSLGKKFVDLLKRNLSSFLSTIRLLTLRIISSFESENNFIMQQCLACEESPLNVYEYRRRIVFLEKLSFDLLGAQNKGSTICLAIYYLLGLLRSNFTPLWPIAIDLIGSYGKKGLDQIGHHEFWSIFNEQFLWIQEEKGKATIEENRLDQISFDFLKVKDENENEINETTFDYVQYRLNLFKVFNKFPSECEDKTRMIFPLVFKFFEEEFYDDFLSSSFFGSNRKSLSVEETSLPVKRLSRKSSVKTLETMLDLLKKFRHFHHWFDGERIYRFYVHLLLSADVPIQRSAFDCLLNCCAMDCSTLKNEFVDKAAEIYPLFDPTLCKKSFHHLIHGVLLEPNVSDSIKRQYAFVVIRILYSKIDEKRSLGSTTRGRKNFQELNRKTIFQFLITFASTKLFDEDFLFFIKLIVEPFVDEIFGSNAVLDQFGVKLSEFDDRISSRRFERFCKFLQHSLSILKSFVDKLGSFLDRHIEPIVRFYLLTIKFADFLSNRKNEEENDFQRKFKISIKKLRSTSYRGLQKIFTVFEKGQAELFNATIVHEIWVSAVKENYLDDISIKKKQRDDLVHLLKLSLVWSQTDFLRKTFLQDRPEAKQFVRILVDFLNQNIEKKNKDIIVEIIFNFLQANPDDPLICDENERLLNYLKQISISMIDSKNSMSLTEKEFEILLVLTRKPSTIAMTEELSSIFVRLLRQNVLTKKKKKSSSKSELVLSILLILENLFRQIENPFEKHFKEFPILFSKIVEREQRINLMKVVQVFIDRSSQENSEQIWFLEQLIELNAWNPNQVDEPDYQRRLTSYRKICELNEFDEEKNEFLCLFHNFLYELKSSVKDLSLREYASQSIDLFLNKMTKFRSIFLNEVRSSLKNTSLSSEVRHEFLRHLSSLIEIEQENEDLLDLKRLKNSKDPELDFFNNILHVQIHRRFRALRRLKLNDEEKPFRSSTVEHFLLPIVCSFVNDVLAEEKQEIHDEIVFQCLTNFSQRLNWSKFNEIFQFYFRQLTNETRSFTLLQKRCLTKTVSSIIDAFHFDIRQEQNEKVSQTIAKRILPMVFNLLNESSFAIEGLSSNGIATKNASIDDQRQQLVLVVVTCSIIATKLIVHFPNEFIEQHISTIILHIAGLLRSRLYSIRDQARDSLSKCVAIFGKRYFKFIVDELIGLLQRGYQKFVLLHTVHNLLIHISTLPQSFTIDPAVRTITELFVEDYFNKEKTESSKQSEHENSTYKPSNIPEAKTNKTPNVMELLGRLIQSSDQLLLCVDPLRQQLIINNESKQISKCEKCLQRFQSGLIVNEHLQMESLFSFVHHLLTKTEQINSESTNQTNSTKSLAEKFQKERDQYHLVPSEPKRGHTRVAQAIQYAKKTNVHCLISWSLTLLHRLIKKYKANDENFISMIDPFISHIEVALNSPHTDVIVSGLRNLSSILEYSLPSLTKQRITMIYKKVFDLLKVYSSVAGVSDLNDLLTLGYKILGIFVQRSIKDDIVLTTDEYLCLFNYIETDLLNVHRQSSAFLLLRSIMRHSVSVISNDKNLRRQLDELLRSRLQSMIVQSPYDHVRSTCRELFNIYLFSYEHTKSKLKGYFDFLLLHLDYQEQSGRQSVLLFLNGLFQDMPKQRLNDHAAYFFVPLSCHFYNETNQECKKLFQQNLQILLERIDEKNRNDLFRNFVLTWTNDVVEHRCLAVQLFVFFIEIERDRFDQFLDDVLKFIHQQINEITLDENDEQQKFNDQYLFHLINVLLHVIKHCSTSVQMLSLRTIWLELLKLIDEKCFLHPHIWIRFTSSQLFGLLFEMVKPDEFIESFQKYSLQQSSNSSSSSNVKRPKKSAPFQLEDQSLFFHYTTQFDAKLTPLMKVQRLCLCACSQMKPSEITEEFRVQVVKNLIYLSKILILSKSEDFELVVRRCCRLTTFESTKHPNEIMRRTAILRWMAAIMLELSSSLDKYLKSFLTVVEREIERDETETNLPLKTLAQDVFDVFKRQSDIHLVTSLYAEIAKQRRAKRLERKQKLAVLAINQPEVVYRKKRVKQTKRLGLGKKKRLKAIEKAKNDRRKKSVKKSIADADDF